MVPLQHLLQIYMYWCNTTYASYFLSISELFNSKMLESLWDNNIMFSIYFFIIVLLGCWEGSKSIREIRQKQLSDFWVVINLVYRHFLSQSLFFLFLFASFLNLSLILGYAIAIIWQIKKWKYSFRSYLFRKINW